MSGRHERDTSLENKTIEKLKYLPAVVTDYYYSLISSGSSYATANSYINYISSFLKFCFKGNVMDDFYNNIKSTHINRYIASLRTKIVNGQIEKTSDSIRAVQWSALNSFFQFLIPEYIKENPVSFTKRPKMKDTPNVTFLESNEIEKIFDNVRKEAKNQMVNRDLCILRLGFSTGLRVSAIAQIDINDIDLKNNKIKVTEKGDKDIYVLIGENLKNQIILWLKDRNTFYGDFETNALFVSQWGNRISTDAIRKLIKKYSNGATTKHVTPHVMRHSCATNLYDKTGDIYLCAKQLNHKNIATTQRYAEISKKRQQEAANILDDII